LLTQTPAAAKAQTLPRGRQGCCKNYSVVLGTAVVSTAVFGVSPKTFAARDVSPNGYGESNFGLAGETPARATGTVALPKTRLNRSDYG